MDYIILLGYIGIMEKKTQTTTMGSYRGSIGVMENKMETTIVYWGYIGIMEMRNGNYLG